MTAFRLKTFSPITEPRLDARAEAELKLQADWDEAYEAGYLAGHSVATEAHLADQGRLTSALVEALSDAGLTNEAARHHVAASLAPLVETLAAAIAPALAEAGIVAEIGRMVARAIDAAPDARPTIRCAPEVADRLCPLLAERGIAAEVAAAAELLPREAQLLWDQGYDHIDLDACTARIRSILAAHLGSEDPAAKADADRTEEDPIDERRDRIA
jgi:hypothetical protein